MNELKNIFAEMQSSFDKRLKSIEDAIKAPKFQVFEKEELIQESVERTLRACNVILTNVPENTEVPDVIIANGILECIDTAIVASPENVMRIGKPIQNKPRLLKVRFKNVETARQVLRKKSALKASQFPNVVIRDDKTPRQLTHLKQLRMELHNRNNNGENLTIRYIHNVPQIIPILQTAERSTTNLN